MLRTCGSCGEIVDDNHICPKRKRYKKITGAVDFRNTIQWQEKRNEIRARDYNLCCVCRDSGIFNYRNISVHHIVPIEEDDSLKLENDNLITLCSTHHTQAERGDISRDYLQKLIPPT